MRKKRRARHRYVWERVWSVAKRAVALFLACMGALAVIKDITQYHASHWVIDTVLGVVSVVSLGVGMLGAKVLHIPELPFLGSQDRENLRCKVLSASELREANALASAFYGRDAISDEVVEQWRLRNPDMFGGVVNSNHEVESSFSVLHLTDSFLDQFIAGKVVESQITAEDIIPLSARRGSRLYIAGVIVKDPRSPRGQMRAGVMLWATMVYLRQFYGVRKSRTLYALAATREGAKLLRRLRFTVVCKASQRQDHHDLYSRVYNRDTAVEMEHRLPDYHQICRVEYDRKRAKSSRKRG